MMMLGEESWLGTRAWNMEDSNPWLTGRNGSAAQIHQAHNLIK
jgi:hypothetical protein